TATAEVLQVINSSPGDLAPVFDTLLDSSLRLCESAYGVLWTYDGECFNAAATRNLPVPLEQFVDRPYRPSPESGLGRMLRSKKIINLIDLAADDAYLSGDPGPVASVELGGARTYLAIPLLREDAVVGAINIYRKEVRRFTDKQIALLENFAVQ